MPTFKRTYLNYIFLSSHHPPLPLPFFLFIPSKVIFKISDNQEFYLRHISRLSCKYSRSPEMEAKNWILKLPKNFESIYVNFYFNHFYKVFRILFVIAPHFLWKMCSANILYIYMVFRRQFLCMLKHMNARNKGALALVAVYNVIICEAPCDNMVTLLSLLNPLLNLPSSSRCIMVRNMSKTHLIHNAVLICHFLMFFMIIFPSCLNCRERNFVSFFPTTSSYFHLVYIKYLCSDVIHDLSQCMLNCYMAGSPTLSNGADFLLSWNIQTQETLLVFISAKSGCRGHARATRHS